MEEEKEKKGGGQEAREQNLCEFNYNYQRALGREYIKIGNVIESKDQNKFVVYEINIIKFRNTQNQLVYRRFSNFEWLVKKL